MNFAGYVLCMLAVGALLGRCTSNLLVWLLVSLPVGLVLEKVWGP